MLTLLFSNAMALTCAIDDVPCNAANEVRDRVNALRPNSIGDTKSGKRSTQFVEARINELLPVADASGCTATGLSVFRIDSAAISGAWVDIDFSGIPVPGHSGTSTGTRTGKEYAGTFTGDQSGDFGDFGRFHLPSGKTVGLRTGGVMAGGIARISGKASVAWAIHGTCPDPSDVAALFTPYMPQIQQHVLFPECLSFVPTLQGDAASGNECGCTDTVCAVDSFCCDSAWDGICVGEAFDLCGDEPEPEPEPDLDPADCSFDVLAAHPTQDPGTTPGDCACIDAVCDIDPFCCNTSWDDVCGDIATETCDGGAVD